MSDYLYEVQIKNGRNHTEWERWKENVCVQLNGKVSDYGGVNNVAVVKHHEDSATVQLLCASGINKKKDVTVSEITAKTLRKKHRNYIDLIDNYFRPHGKFPNL